MLRNTLILIFNFFLIAYGQITDSISTELLIYPDTVSVKSDFLLLNDSLITVTEQDSIVPIYSKAFTNKSTILRNSELLKLEYKYTGDYLRAFPFTFIKDLGFTGQPDETFLYGIGNNAINFLMDGISYNDRLSNSLNLNLIQSEDVDSIEIVRLPRGFLYGTYNNPVSVNFITKDFIQTQPYTRIRFYQGANRDMMLDGSFNAIIFKRLIASFDITNRIFDGTYKNSDYSIWQGKIKLKYLLSNEVNIIASYNYNNYKAGYSGGVDVDSIFASAQDPNKVMYDSRAAPMRYINGKLKTLTHLPRLRFLIKPAKWMNSDASFYFLFSRYEQSIILNNYNENKTYGLNLRNDFDYGIFNFRLNLDYEKGSSYRSLALYSELDSVWYSLTTDLSTNLFSASGIISAYISDRTFVPSVFYKTSSLKRTSNSEFQNNFIEDFNSTGLGFDMLVLLKSSLGFYFGASMLNPYYSNDTKFVQIELGVKYSNDFLSADVKYFINDYYNLIYTGGVFYQPVRFGNVKGLGLNFDLNYWKLNLSSRSALYASLKEKTINIPDFQTQIGLYYKDVLFNNNLDLKTGFVFYYTGKNNVFTDAYLINKFYDVPSSYKLDFTLAGEIQKTAIVYFVWQNLFDNEYYITPYYPMPSRSIRFGVAWEMFN